MAAPIVWEAATGADQEIPFSFDISCASMFYLYHMRHMDVIQIAGG